MRSLALALTLALPQSLLAGHSRAPYCDGGQSADGRYSVIPELVTTPGSKANSSAYSWKYTWKDAKTGTTITGKLEGLRSGTDAVFDPTHAHIFVAPGADTFAVWNPNVVAFTNPANAKWPELTSPEARTWDGFTHRLTIYTKAGAVVKCLDLKDFLEPDDWKWLFCYGRQVYWQANFPGLTRDNAPRVGYALYQVSPDYTVLETLVGATDEAKLKAKVKAKVNGITPPAPRLVCVNLVTGEFLDPAVKPADVNKVPVRPFKGALSGRGEKGQATYKASLDPIRIEGTYGNAK